MAGYTYIDMYHSAWNFEGRVYWKADSNGTTANSSNVYMEIQVRRNDGYSTTGTFYGEINLNEKTEAFSWYGTVGSSWQVVKSKSDTKKHNDDGTGATYLAGWCNGPDGTSLDGEYVELTGSAAWRNLDTIPRYTSITSFTVNKRDETSLRIDFTAADTLSKVEYSTNNGSSWTTYSNSLNAKSGTINVTGLSANTEYSCKVRVTRKDSGLQTTSGTVKQTTYDYPKVSAVQTSNLIIGNAQKLTLYNPLSRSVTVQMRQNPTVYEEDISLFYTGTTNGTSITFTPNTTKMYQSIPNSTSSTCSYWVVYNSITKVTNGNSYSVNTSASIPTFSDFEYKDITSNDLITAIGNNQVLVQNVSNVNLVISSTNKMVAKNSATAKNYQATFSNLSKTINYSSSNIDTNLGIPTGSGNQIFKVTAYDSRNLSKEVSKSINIIAYANPIINVELYRVNNFEAETKLKLSGTFSRVTVNNADKNLIKTCQYRYKETGSSTWGSWTSMTISSQGNGSYATNVVTLSLDNSKSFDFEFQVTDRAKTSTSSGTLSIGKPLMFLHTNGDLDIGSHSISNDGANYSGSATKWAGTTYDMSTVNDTDTWIPVIASNKMQHTTRQKWTSKTHSNYNNNQNQLATISCLTYWNGAYNSSNASNLTYAHQGTIQCKPTQLYNNTSGTTGTITLSQTAANFTYLIIYYGRDSDVDSTNRYDSTRIYSPNGKKACLTLLYQYKTGFQFVDKTINISGTSVTNTKTGVINIDPTKVAYVSQNENSQKIFRIEGWK